MRTEAGSGLNSPLQTLGREGARGRVVRKEGADGRLRDQRGSGSTVGRGAGLGDSVKSCPVAGIPGRARQDRAWVGGRLEAGVLGSSSHLVTWSLSQTLLDLSSQLLNLAQSMETYLTLCPKCNFHLLSQGAVIGRVALAVCLSDICVVASE